MSADIRTLGKSFHFLGISFPTCQMRSLYNMNLRPFSTQRTWSTRGSALGIQVVSTLCQVRCQADCNLNVRPKDWRWLSGAQRCAGSELYRCAGKSAGLPRPQGERGQLHAGHRSAVTDRAFTLTEERCCLHYWCYEYRTGFHRFLHELAWFPFASKEWKYKNAKWLRGSSLTPKMKIV